MMSMNGRYVGSIPKRKKIVDNTRSRHTGFFNTMRKAPNSLKPIKSKYKYMPKPDLKMLYYLRRRVGGPKIAKVAKTVGSKPSTLGTKPPPFIRPRLRGGLTYRTPSRRPKSFRDHLYDIGMQFV